MSADATREIDRLLKIAAIVNGYFNGDDYEDSVEAMKQIADALGEPIATRSRHRDA